MDPLSALVFVSFLIAAYVFVKLSDVPKDLPTPSPCWPVLGNVPFSLFFDKTRTVNEVVFDLQRKWTNVYHEKGYMVVRLGWKYMVMIFKADLVQALIKDSAMINKSKEYRFIKPWLGDGLITSNGQTWKRRRRQLNPAFHINILNEFLPTVNEECRHFLNKLDTQTGLDSFDVKPMVSNFTLRTITATFLGAPVDYEDVRNFSYWKSIDYVCQSFIRRVVNPLIWLDQVFYGIPEGKEYIKAVNYLHNYTIEIMRKIRNQETATVFNEKPKKSFIELLFECSVDGEKLTETEIREELDTIVFAGHDTTSCALKWILYYVGRNPFVQSKIKLELKEIFGHDNKDVEISADHLRDMNYIECVIKEALRLYPPVPNVGRILHKDTVVDGKLFRQGTTILLPLHILHRDPDVFENPNQFYPERFLLDNNSTVKEGQTAYAPFAVGPRNCIGQRFAMIEMKTLLAHLFLNYTLTSVDPEESMKASIDIVYKPESPVRVTVSRD